ncbi:hypothetical protein HK102_009058, partial [Quaeritorhiza haematococci]
MNPTISTTKSRSLALLTFSIHFITSLLLPTLGSPIPSPHPQTSTAVSAVETATL